MRVKEIYISNLFGLFNHKIDFNLNERITIIHGPNGFGKTILLKFINSFFNKTYTIFHEIPFDEFFIKFTNNTILKIVKDSKNNLKITIENSENDEMNVPKLNVDNFDFPPSVIEEFCPYVSYIGRERWFDKRDLIEINLEKVIEKYGHHIISNLPSGIKKKIEDYDEKEWFINITDSINVRFIQTQRLLAIRTPRKYGHRFRGDLPMMTAVNLYSKELIEEIQEVLAEYAKTSQSLDRTFPKRLMTEKIKKLNREELSAELEKLEEKRLKLIELGLLEKEEEDFQPEKIEEGSEKVLSVYIEDVKNKLSIFNKLAEKINILKKILDDHFLYKTVNIDKDEGFIFTNTRGKQVQPQDLSSGEQHELVLLYELLFKVKENSLILIDEPEISLHVAWQKKFLKDIQGISNISKFDILIATHSPQIINDRWDLTVKLKGLDG